MRWLRKFPCCPRACLAMFGRLQPGREGWNHGDGLSCGRLNWRTVGERLRKTSVPFLSSTHSASQKPETTAERPTRSEATRPRGKIQKPNRRNANSATSNATETTTSQDFEGNGSRCQESPTAALRVSKQQNLYKQRLTYAEHFLTTHAVNLQPVQVRQCGHEAAVLLTRVVVIALCYYSRRGRTAWP